VQEYDLIREKAKELAYGVVSEEGVSENINEFVRDRILYCLDEWDVKPMEVLKKGRGMCAGKALLASELHRAMGISTRFKVIKVLGEGGILDFVMHRLEEGKASFLSLEERERVREAIFSLPPERDHIILQVFLHGQWRDFDIARDRDLDRGMRLLGIRGERKVISEEGVFDSLDRWIEERMRRRTILRDRELVFRVINEQIERIRSVGFKGLI
jgi:transglutaminase-like putative cysteine protease